MLQQQIQSNNSFDSYKDASNKFNADSTNFSGIKFSSGDNIFDGSGRYFSSAEIEFIAENSSIQIRPKINLEELYFLTVINNNKKVHFISLHLLFCFVMFLSLG